MTPNKFRTVNASRTGKKAVRSHLQVTPHRLRRTVSPVQLQPIITLRRRSMALHHTPNTRTRIHTSPGISALPMGTGHIQATILSHRDMRALRNTIPKHVIQDSSLGQRDLHRRQTRNVNRTILLIRTRRSHQNTSNLKV